MLRPISTRGSMLLLAAGVALPAPACAGAARTAAVQAPSDTSVVLAREYVSPTGSRKYRLFVPAGHTPSRPAPLVVLLHGCTQGPEDLARGSRFDALGGEAGALVVYPEQPEAAHPKKCWNWYDPAHQARDGGEPAMLAEMTREVAAAYGVDPRRIYIGGLSAGAAMAVLTAVAYPDLFAAVGSHSGLGWRVAGDLATGLAAMRGAGPDSRVLAERASQEMGGRARVVPLIVLHGAADPVVGPTGSERLAEQFALLHDMVAGAERTPLLADTTRAEAGGYSYRLRRLREPGGRVVIEDWLIDGLGHALSGGSAEGKWTDQKGPDGAREMLRFFLEHPRAE
jgi:poly(hydroxyalkanoate) depolymerase family esterase